MNILEFYKLQSLTSSPGKYAYLFDDMPDNIVELCDVIRDLFIHMADEDVVHFKIPQDRYKEMDSRYVVTIMENILSKDNRALKETRDLKDRAIGICRDQALLVCSILRHKGIPARLRVGFGDYFVANVYLDGIWLEYWDAKKNKWCMVDVRTSEVHIKKYNLKIDFDLYDMPEGKMLPAELAWKLCRDGTIKKHRIGSRHLRGLWYVRNRLVQSLATLNKKEVLTWDVWGVMLDSESDKILIEDERLKQLDSLSEFLLNNSDCLEKLLAYYAENSLWQVPSEVAVYNPFNSPENVVVNI